MYLLKMEAEIPKAIIVKSPTFYRKGCKWSIITPRRRVYNKINSGVPMFPYSYYCYFSKVGTLLVTHRCNSKRKAHQKIDELITIDQIGRFQSEGMGELNWKGVEIVKYTAKKKEIVYKVAIRRGLPHNLTEEQQKLLKMALLHDFVPTEKHKSKIYKEIELEDKELVELLKKHHEKTDDPLIQQLQKYDRIASIKTRQVRSPRLDRYNWRAKAKVNFEALVKEITEMSNNVWKLYDYIFKSKKLDILNESLQYGHTSLRYHVLLTANLLVQSFQ